MQYIELFAGCGGLSLGLKSVGFKLAMANELSPMAGESYAFNFFNEDLKREAEKTSPKLKKTLWLSSQYALTDLKSRLREDPRENPNIGKGVCDIKPDGSNLLGSLVIGSIVDLNKWIKKNSKAASVVKYGLNSEGIDLVSGGPPCQSFSMAGLRQLESDKNTLPWEFAKFTQLVQPKFVILENVTGILRPFKDKEGKSYFAWFEVAKAFASIGYVPLCLHLNAKLAGVPQNRPRFILLGVRSDIFKLLESSFNSAEKELFKQPAEFFKKTRSNQDVELDSLSYRDISRPADVELFKTSFLKAIVANSDEFISVSDAIDDLRKNGTNKSSFPSQLSKTFSKVISGKSMKNHEFRNNNFLVKRRFRLYQVLQLIDSDTRKHVLAILKGVAHDLRETDWEKISSFDFLVESGDFVRFKTKNEFLSFLGRHATKKQTQKALLAHQPAPAALSIPDDACHYHHDELRTLTVREMARIQSFPDNFEFRSKVTTGGTARSFEVPQYTQVGNAVPPLLGRALGLAVSNLLERLY